MTARPEREVGERNAETAAVRLYGGGFGKCADAPLRRPRYCMAGWEEGRCCPETTTMLRPLFLAW